MIALAKPFVPHFYQSEATDATFDYWRRGGGNGVIVLPTGAGKSPTIGMVAKRTYEDLGCRVCVATHRSELVEGDADNIRMVWPNAPIGVYAAGLFKRSVSGVTVGMINSIYNKAELIGPVGLLVIDEAHRVPTGKKSMYGDFIGEMMKISPKMRILGLTATPFRTDQGRITTGPFKVFDSIVYRAEIRRLIDEGYIAPLVPAQNSHEIDTRGMKVQAATGDFSEADIVEASNRTEVNEAACSDVHRELLSGRTSAMMFAADVAHAHALCAGMRERGVTAAVVTGATSRTERDMIYRAFKARRLSVIVSVDVLTTGFDAKNVDVIAVVRPIGSVVLWIQVLGRGCRIEEFKFDCRVLDYAGNTARNGTIDDPKIKENRDEQRKSAGGMRKKFCAHCEAECPANAPICKECGLPFGEAENADEETEDDATGLTKVASTMPLISDGTGTTLEEYRVERIEYAQINATRARPYAMMRVDYFGCQIGLPNARIKKITSEMVCLEHPIGEMARSMSTRWWRDGALNSNEDPPTDVWSAVQICTRRDGRKRCIRLVVRRKKGEKDAQIVRREYAEKPTQTTMFELDFDARLMG